MSTTEVVWPASYCLDGDEESLRALAEYGGAEGEARFARAMSAAAPGAGAKVAFDRALVVGLLKEYTGWRERRVERIEPVTDQACRTIITLQIRIPARMVREAVDRATSIVGGADDLTGSQTDPQATALPAADSDIMRGETPFKCVLPMARFPKRALMELSVRDRHGNPVSLLTRRDGAEYSAGFLTFLLSHAGIEEEQFEPLLRILRALIYCMPFDREQEQYCKSIGIVVPLSSPDQIARWVVDRISTRFPHFIAPIDFPWGMWDRTSRALKDYFDYYAEEELPFFYEMHKNPVRNPLILAADYLEYHCHPDGSFAGDMNVQEVLEQFFQDCVILSETVRALASGRHGEEARFLVDEIASFWRTSVAFAQCEVSVEESGTFAIDQLQPFTWVRRSRPADKKPKTSEPKRVRPKRDKKKEKRPGMESVGESRPARDQVKKNKPSEDKAKAIVPPDKKKPASRPGQAQKKYGRSNSMRFDVAIGDARSTHVEIRSSDPANLTIAASRSHIELGEKRLSPLIVFDETSHAPGVQHFYATRERPQVAHVKRNNLEQPAESNLSEEDRQRLLDEESVALRVTFLLRSTLRWLHAGALSFTVLAIVLIGLIAGLRLFGKANTYTGNLAYFLVFLAFALAASLFALFPMREMSPIVTARLEVVKKLQLLSLVVLWAVTIVALIVLA